LKTLNAPSHWMLGKMCGKWAPRPSPGPHKLRECLPLILILRNRLKYALSRKEVTAILMQRFIKIDGKVRTDFAYPAGFQDVLSIEQTSEFFRMLYDVKGRFTLHPITGEEAKFKLCRVRRQELVRKGVPVIVTHDARTIRYPDPEVRVNDTVKVDLETGKVVDFVKFEVGNLSMVTGGHSKGRIGTIVNRERHLGSFDIIHLQDAAGNKFATRLNNVFVLGKGNKSMISLPKQRGIKLSILEEKALKQKD
jgi:small subunit ribosomal protein S4e